VSIAIHNLTFQLSVEYDAKILYYFDAVPEMASNIYEMFTLSGHARTR
jgi:hypothetical protein